VPEEEKNGKEKRGRAREAEWIETPNRPAATKVEWKEMERHRFETARINEVL
jgi:hypothetical protein